MDETQVSTVADVLPWLERAIKQHFPKAQYQRSYQTAVGRLQTELQKIYDSEINIEISWVLDGPINVKLGNEFYGFDDGGCGHQHGGRLAVAPGRHPPALPRIEVRRGAARREMGAEVVWPEGLHD